MHRLLRETRQSERNLYTPVQRSQIVNRKL
nr:MAG TPA: hypothetical protein [Caudoviricetes sp.]